MGKLTISMAIFNSYVAVYQRVGFGDWNIYITIYNIWLSNSNIWLSFFLSEFSRIQTKYGYLPSGVIKCVQLGDPQNKWDFLADDTLW